MSAQFEIRAPAGDLEGTRSQVLRWLKGVGEPVTQNEPLLELETDKVTVEVAAPASGVLVEILCREQDEIEPGALLGRIGIGSPAQATASAAAPAHETRSRVAETAAPDSPRPAATGRSAPALSPAVRRLLAERGLNPADVRGSGEGGRITVDDVLAHSSAKSTPPSPATAQPEQVPASREGVRTIPHSPVRKRVAEHMVQSLLHTAPHVTSVFEADMAAVLAHRAQHRAAFEQLGTPITLTAYFVAATVAAIRAVPEANSRWTDAALEIYDTLNIGIATALANGELVVPVLREVEKLDFQGIVAGLHELVTRARSGKLTPADVRGGTFTISNHGVSGSLLATPIVINQPQSAILGVGKLEKRAVVVEENATEKIVARPRCYVTLTIDHRVMDGYHANRFLQTLVASLEAWGQEPA